jgi:hypothetical protein
MSWEEILKAEKTEAEKAYREIFSQYDKHYESPILPKIVLISDQGDEYMTILTDKEDTGNEMQEGEYPKSKYSKKEVVEIMKKKYPNLEVL